MELLDQELTELLDPSDLVDLLDGVEADVSLRILKKSRLGRAMLNVEVALRNVEPNLWGLAFLPAERLTLLVDEEMGIILRIGCWLGDREYSVIEVSELALNKRLDPTLFEVPVDPG